MGLAGADVPNPRYGVLMSAPDRNGKPGYSRSPLAIRYGQRNGSDSAITEVICASDRHVGPASAPPGQRSTRGSKWQPSTSEMILFSRPSRPSQALITLL